MKPIVRLSLASFAAALLLPLSLSAQEEAPPPPAGTIIVEQRSDIGAYGVWTVLQPNHESFERADKTLSMPNLMPGKYSLFTVPPKGTTAHIDVSLGDDVIQSSDTPQISFDLADKMTLKIVVTFRLTIFGKVGVNSDPVGIPFDLRGPNSMVRSGVTPAEFSPFPIGNYSITYKPAGCPQPPAKSGSLEQEGRIDFMVEIVCDTFKPVEAEEKHRVVTTEIGGTMVTFSDVPLDTWFGPYIATVTKRAIMSGYTDTQGKQTGIFGPGDPVTIAQLAKVAHTAMKINEQAVTTASRNPFARGQWFRRYIASAEELGWLVYVDGTVDPHRPATRGEVLATLLQILDIPVHWAKGTVFTDVLRKTPWSSAIETAAAEGIVTGPTGPDGKPTGLFHPTDSITRAELAKILIVIREKYQNRDEGE